MKSLADYQRERARCEQQALVRAADRGRRGHARTLRRGAHGHARAGARRARDVIEQVIGMRCCWRVERDRSTAELFDLKQGQGALLDIEFLLQALVLIHAREHATLLRNGNTASLIALARQVGLLERGQARARRCACDAARALADLHARCAPATGRGAVPNCCAMRAR